MFGGSNDSSLYLCTAISDNEQLYIKQHNPTHSKNTNKLTDQTRLNQNKKKPNKPTREQTNNRRRTDEQTNTKRQQPQANKQASAKASTRRNRDAETNKQRKLRKTNQATQTPKRAGARLTNKQARKQTNNQTNDRETNKKAS